MTKSELIDIIAAKQNQLSAKDVELAVKTLIELMSETLATGEIGRNPKTGESVGLAGKYVPHFKPGKDLRDKVNQGLQQELADANQAPAAVAVPTPITGTSLD
jgi:integration host factor subunit beta